MVQVGVMVIMHTPIKMILHAAVWDMIFVLNK